MRSSRSLGPELWRAIVEKLIVGVVVLSPHGVVIYANDEAGRLLDYKARDVLGLDAGDLVALCQPDRLDAGRFSSALIGGYLPEQPGQVFNVTTHRRRLNVTPFALDLETQRIMIVLMQEDTHWRGDLIAHTVMTEMDSPLDFAAQYCGAMSQRIGKPDAPTDELMEFARIIHNAIRRAQALWATLFRLYDADPRQMAVLTFEPVQIGQAVRAAARELEGRAIHSLPTLRLNLPGDLPPVRAVPDRLHAALVALLEEAVSRLTPRDDLAIIARDKGAYLRVDLALGPSAGVIRGYLFDVLPLSIVEQAILQHSGRIWTHSGPGHSATISFSIPVWAEHDAARSQGG